MPADPSKDRKRRQPKAVDPGNEPTRFDPFDPGHLLGVLTIAGAVVYAVSRATQEGFYDALGVSVEEVGLDYVALVGRAVVVGMVLFALGSVVVLPLVVLHDAAKRWQSPAKDDLLRRWDSVPDLMKAGVALAAAVAMAVALRKTFGWWLAAVMVGEVAVLIGLDLLRAAKPLKWLAAALVSLTVVVACAFFVGDHWGTQVSRRCRVARPLLAQLLIVRWPEPVTVMPVASSDVELPDQLLLATHGGIHLLYSQDESTISRVPVEAVRLGTRRVPADEVVALPGCGSDERSQ